MESEKWKVESGKCYYGLNHEENKKGRLLGWGKEGEGARETGGDRRLKTPKAYDGKVRTTSGGTFRLSSVVWEHDRPFLQTRPPGAVSQSLPEMVQVSVHAESQA